MTKVLYVEYNDDNLYMLKTRLELLGDFEVLAAEDSDKGYTHAPHAWHNLKTAKTLGLDVPPTLLARADEVIE